MFVLCDTCHNHYDDASQSKKCHGPGSAQATFGEGWASSHRVLRPAPITEHRYNTRLARTIHPATATETGRARPSTPTLVYPATDPQRTP